MEENKKSLCRIPRALSDKRAKIKIEKELYTLGGNVGLDIVIFVCTMQNKDLFGEPWFSIEDFCKAMGYTRTHLQKKVPIETMKNIFGEDDPIHFVSDINGNKIEHRLENVFECVLHKLGYQVIGFVDQSEDASYNYTNIINRFDIRVNSSTIKQSKRLYRVKVNDRFKEAFFNNYHLIEATEYRKLPDRTGYREFYLNLCKMIAIVKYKKKNGETPCFTMTVDELADVFDIQIALSKDRKKKVTAILNSINKTLEASKFLFEYIKGKNERWAYTVKFQFSDETLQYFDEQFMAVFIKRYYDNLLTEYAKMKYPTLDRRNIWLQRERISKDIYEIEQFHKWCFSESEISIKSQIFKATSIDLCKMNPEDAGMNINELFKKMQQSD